MPAADKSALVTLCTSTGLALEKHELFRLIFDISSQSFTTDSHYVHATSVRLLKIINNFILRLVMIFEAIVD